MDTQVLVVGAGLAGLAAADALVTEGYEVVVWEARSRVGGRTLTQQVGGVSVDLGAQWLGPAQHRMADLVRRFDLATFPTYDQGSAVLIDDGRRRTFKGTVPLLGPLQLGRMAMGLRTFRRMAAEAGPPGTRSGVPDPAPSLAAALDGPVGSGAARRVVDTAIRVIFGAEPEELDAGWVAAYAAAAGGELLDLVAIEGGAQQTRLVGGTQAISLHLAERLDVQLQRPVVRLDRDTDGVTATSADGEELRASHVIVAVPASLASTIHHDPRLPPERLALEQRMPMGATTKVFAFYDEPFWRDRGLRGEAVLTEGPVQVVFDNTSHDGSVASLLAFVTGEAAHHASAAPQVELEAEVMASLSRAFGPRAAKPEQLLVHQWQHERWSGGCPVANPAVGTYARIGAQLRRPVGRLHWAGTETAADWTGYMEGAVASGRRAAQEVIGAGPTERPTHDN